MLTDEQIIAIADSTRTAESGSCGYILPISIARAIEAEVRKQDEEMRSRFQVLLDAHEKLAGISDRRADRVKRLSEISLEQDEALIRQMLKALVESNATLWEEDDDPARPAQAAIAAARARLGEGGGVAVTPALRRVGTIKSWTNGSYWRNYQVTWHSDALEEGTELYAEIPVSGNLDLAREEQQNGR